MGKFILTALFVIQFILIALINPSFTCGAISGEKERKTYELLVTTLLSPVDIIFGKVLHSVSYCFLFILSSLPVTCTVFFIGGVSPTEIIILYVVLFMSVIFFSLFGIYYSARFSSTNAAIRTTYVVIFIFGSFLVYAPVILYQGSPLLAYIPFIFFSMPPWIFVILNMLFIILLLFFSSVKLVEVPRVKPSSEVRILSALFFMFNMFPVTGAISDKIASMTDIKDISEMMAIFFTVIMGGSLIFIVSFSCALPGRKTGTWLKNLFYPHTVSSIFFVPLLGTVTSLLFSSVCIYNQPLLSAMMERILLSSLLIFFILMSFSLMGRFFLYVSATKIYAHVCLVVLIIIITFLPICIHAYNNKINHSYTIMELTFLNPLFGIVSVWEPEDSDSLVSVMNKHIPVYIISFISYVPLLIFFSLGNFYLRKKEIGDIL
ncbi:MAG: hypothetical protein ABRQ37_08680 [Candidatus Eremiobacterota bacterium]